MIEPALRAALIADATVAALIDERVYPLVLPQAPTYPALTYQLITGNRHYSHDGPVGLADPRIQINCYDNSYEGVVSLKNAVVAALGGFKGDAGSPPVRIQGAFLINEIDFHEDGLERAGPRVWRKSLDFNIWFEETT